MNDQTIEMYGHKQGREVVPGKLRGFRLFRVAWNGDLYSMVQDYTWRNKLERAECEVGKVVKAVNDLDNCRCVSQLEGNLYFPDFRGGYRSYIPYECKCWTLERIRHYMGSRNLPKYRTLIGTTVMEKHHDDSQTPLKECTCGFYAAYNSKSLWGAPGCNLDIWGGYVGGAWSGFVLGVVEASGKIILGERGFRSEKMQILDITCVHNDPGGPWVSQSFLQQYPPDDVSALLKG